VRVDAPFPGCARSKDGPTTCSASRARAASRCRCAATQFSLIAADPAVREFQVVQRIVLRLALRDDAAPDAADRVARAVAGRLGALGVDRPAVEADAVAATERTAAGKLKLVVTERPAGDPPAARNRAPLTGRMP